MYSTVYKLSDSSQSIGMILADIGIKTGLYTEKGQLHIDEERLREALTKNPETVISLLTQKASLRYSPYLSETEKEQYYNESGLFNRIENIISVNTSTTLVKGVLIELVGKDSSSVNDIYSRKIAKMQNTIAMLNDRLIQKENYYWAKFNAMESALSKLNAQSTWLNSMFTSN